MHISQCKLLGGVLQKQGYKLSETASCKNFTPAQARHQHYKFLKTRWLGNSRSNVIASSLLLYKYFAHTHSLLLGWSHHSTCTPGKPSGLSVHHAVPVEVVGGGQQHQQLHPGPHQLAWPEPRPLIPRAQHRGAPPRHPPYSSYLPDDGRCCLHENTLTIFASPLSSEFSSFVCLLFQMTRHKCPRCEQTKNNLFGSKPKTCDLANCCATELFKSEHGEN